MNDEARTPSDLDSDPSPACDDALLTRVLDDMVDPFFVFDSGWRFRYVNHAAAKLMGFEDDELLGMLLEDVFPDDVATSQFRHVYEDSMRLGVPQSFEAYFPPADRWLEVRVQPYEDGVSIQLTDVTTRRTIAEELRRSQQMLTALLENHDIGMSVGSPDGSVRFYNKAMEELSGFTQDEVNEHGWFELVFPDPEERAAAVELAMKALAGDVPYIETEITRKDGERRWVSFSLAPIEVGTESYNFGITLDISERKQSDLEREALVQELNAIDQIADAALSTLEPDALLEGILGRLLNLLNANVGIVATRARTWVVMRDPDDVADNDRPPSSIMNMRSFRQAPLHYAEEDLGAIQVGWTVDRPSELRDDRILALAAARIGAAVMNSRLHSETSETARLSQALVRINEEIHGSLAIGGVMQDVIEEACLALGVDAGVVLLPHGMQVVAEYAYGFPEDAAKFRVLDRDAIASLAAIDRTHKPYVVDDTGSDANVNRELVDLLAIRSLLSVPLAVHGESLDGMLAFFHRDRTHQFTKPQVRFARSLSNSIALALDNARLYAAEHEIAESLQDALVEMPERVRGQRLAHVYRSARSMAGSVGGDFYDAFELEGGRVAIVIGDVSGKGLGAAVLTSLLKNAMRAHATDDDSPSVALSKTNRLTALQTDPEMFATAILAVLDVETGELVFCNAGHPPLLIRRTDGSVHVEPPNSPLIGAFEHMTYAESSLRLADGDIVVMYTDGVLEARCDGELYGTHRLEQLVAELDDPRRIAEGVLEAAAAFADERLADDIAVVALRYRAPK